MIVSFPFYISMRGNKKKLDTFPENSTLSVVLTKLVYRLRNK